MHVLVLLLLLLLEGAFDLKISSSFCGSRFKEEKVWAAWLGTVGEVGGEVMVFELELKDWYCRCWEDDRVGTLLMEAKTDHSGWEDDVWIPEPILSGADVDPEPVIEEEG